MKPRRSDIAQVTRWSGSIFEKGFITPSGRNSTRVASMGAMCVGTKSAVAAIAVRCWDFGKTVSVGGPFSFQADVACWHV
jgi:hypothetical protein